MKSLALRLVVLAAAVMAPQQRGDAAGSHRIAFATVWTVAPGQTWSEARTIARHSAVVEARLLPRRLVAPAADVRDRQGQLLAPREAQLIALQSRVGIYCLAEPGTHMSAFRNRAFPCFVDQDGDGRVESWFNARSLRSDMLLLLGTLPEQRAEVAPTAIAEAAPADLRSGPSISLDFEGLMSLSHNLRFFTRVGQGGDRTVFGPPYDVSAGALPAKLDILGASFNLIAVTDGQVRLEMIRPFDGRAIVFQ